MKGCLIERYAPTEFYFSKLGIGIDKTNAGIGIPASMISVRYRNKKNAGLHQLSPVPDRFRHH
jgi:hypothetical protein